MFSSFQLHDPLLQAIEKMGLSEPTEVQMASLPLALEYKDLLVSAKTGSGKTVAFLLPLIQHLLDDTKEKHDYSSTTQALILVPTRELARQINKQCLRLTEFTHLTTTTIIGGEDPKHQLIRLQETPDIIIATPGRLLEHLHRESIDVSEIQVLVLDEADRMLSMGFSDEVIEIAAHCNESRQTMLFSASLNHDFFKEMIETLLYEPETIILNTIREKHESIVHQMVLADDVAHKAKLLAHFSTEAGFEKVLAFTNTRQQVENLGALMQSLGVKAGTLHGEMDQKQRNSIVSKLRNGNIKLLIATDVASRGLDIPKIDCVINFDLARNGEDYAHRAGRTGRGTENGTAIALINANEWDNMISIQHFLDIHFKKIKAEGLEAKYKGPKKLKKSGKAAGKSKKDRPEAEKKPVAKTKNRLRDRKNIGKRRKPTVKDPAADQ